MLQIRDICKQYRTGDFVQKALDGVSLSFRDHEFVSILGPSGSGKTTLLNIIGGLDRYDAGDLIINGVSTRRFRDRDWDAYRNHTIGFVFQSYNLIMHQSVRSNVELALTISGITGGERKRRAEEALRKVGLEKHMDKKPDQLSGGQMQRVAIARALVNDPDIILADEPTGALDSDTSVQVMEILKEIAKDHLVVMVTHNPELARRYATRTVTIRDGKLLSDTDPFEPDGTGEEAARPVRKKFSRSGMSFRTALSLSLSNLRTKKARTLTVSVAGSIGIIGISLVLALSNGVNRYISDQETAALSQYPVEIDRTGIDVASLMGGTSDASGMANLSADGREGKEKDGDGRIGVRNMMKGLLSNVTTNDLASFKAWLEKDGRIRGESDAVEYRYDVTPLIYREGNGKTVQVNPANLLEGLDLGDSQMSTMMGNAMNMDVFSMLPESRRILSRRYTLEAGRWPEQAEDIVLILSADGRVNDSVLYALGMRDRKELGKLVQAKDEEKSRAGIMDSDGTTYRYGDFLGMHFKAVSQSALYERDDKSGLWIDRSGDDSYVRKALKEGITLTVSGIVRQKDSSSSAMSDSGFAYTEDLLSGLMRRAAESAIVRDQMGRKDINVLTGHTFEADNDPDQLDLGSLITVDQDAVQNLLASAGLQSGGLNLDMSSLADAFSGMDLSGLNLPKSLDLSALQSALPQMSGEQLEGMLDGVIRDVPQEELRSLFSKVMQHYTAYAAADPSTNYAGLSDALLQYLTSDETAKTVQTFLQQKLTETGNQLVSRDDLLNLTSDVMADFPAYLEKRLSENASGSSGGVLQPLSAQAVRALLDQKLSETGRDTFTREELLNLASDVMNNLPSYLQALLPDGTGSLPDSGALSQILQDYLQEPSTREKADQAFSDLTGRFRNLTLSQDELGDLMQKLAAGYTPYARDHQLPDPSRLTESLPAYFRTDEGRKDLSQMMAAVLDTDRLQKNLSTMVSDGLSGIAGVVTAQLQTALRQGLESAAGAIQTALSDQMGQLMAGMAGGLSGLADPGKLQNIMKMNLAPDQIRSLLTGMLTGNGVSYEGNLTKFGYASTDDPSEIDIYPKDFSAKNRIKKLITKYNDRAAGAGEEEKTISYSDMISAMMSSVTNIVDTVSVVMIAFISISLVVSSIMIGVITYISVLERKKEIGILRAMGASKRNVANVFNAETFLTGLLSGTIGVVSALLFSIPVNRILPRFVNGADVKIFLAPRSAALMILLSIGLTLLAGLIPSTQASRNDPVRSLRSE